MNNIKMELTETSYNVDWIHPTRTETSEEVMQSSSQNLDCHKVVYCLGS